MNQRPSRIERPHRRALRIGIAALLGTLSIATLSIGAISLAVAQEKSKKLYCWNENGKKLCSDTLPPHAVDRQRTEINQSSGTAVREVSRALTDAEREQAVLDAKAAETEAARLRREMAMVHTFATEADLERSYRNRFDLLDESLKGSAISIKNLRQSLLGLLRQANDAELQNQPVGKRTIDKIRAQKLELRQLVDLQQRQTIERAELDMQFQNALLRYRELKRAIEAGTAPAIAPTAAPTPAGG
jgi:hypothetical protein